MVFQRTCVAWKLLNSTASQVHAWEVFYAFKVGVYITSNFAHFDSQKGYKAMQENTIHKVGLIIAAADGEKFKVLLAKTRAGHWRLPSTALADALTQCDKEAVEPFRADLNLGKSSYVNNLFFRDSRDKGTVTRFYALKCSTPEQALEETARVLECQTRWASFEEASWIVAAEELEVTQWGERLLTPKVGA